MPEACDPAVYRERAKRWRDKATCLPELAGDRAVCLEIAEGYERLADLLEALRSRSRHLTPLGK
jgi:hypothetical protein